MPILAPPPIAAQQNAQGEREVEASQGPSADPPHRHDFAFGKHNPDIFNRLVLEVAGAQFVMKMSSTNANKRSASPTQDDIVDVNALLQPKKKAKRSGAGPKRKAAAAASGKCDEDADQLTKDVTMGTTDGAVGGSRARWWIDDVFASLAHAAGSILSDSCLGMMPEQTCLSVPGPI